MNREVTAFLRLEGLAVLLAAVAVYASAGQSWWLFLLLFLAPDLSMLGYLKDPRFGAAVYNTFHTYPGPVLLGGAAWWTGQGEALHGVVVWVAHIGFDRALEFGLKHPSAFEDTHLGVLGGSR